MGTSIDRETEHTIAACLAAGRTGIAVGNRLSVPFRADLLSIIIGLTRSMLGEPDLLTDFSHSAKHATVVEKDDRTDIYFADYPSLQKDLGGRKGTVILTCCELNDDIFNPATHQRLILDIQEDDMRVDIARQES